MNENAAAGWYSDGQGNERYWDGAGWTQEVRSSPAPHPAAAEPVKQSAFSKLGSAVRKVAADRQSAKDELAREHEATAAAAGRLVTSGVFGTSTIEIYEGGYVRVAEGTEDHVQAVAIKKSTPFEKLSSIKFTESDQEKAASAPQAPSLLAGSVGNAVTSIMSGGKSLMKGTVPGLAVAGVTHLAATGSRRSILVVVTDKAIHTMTNQYKNSVGIKTSNKGHSDVARALQSAGYAVLGLPDPASAPVSEVIESPQERPAPAAPTIAERLRELSALHQEGILSDAEFAESKARVLAGL